MVSQVKDNMSKVYALKFSSENGNSSRVRYKRRYVSAVRDFPPGCGPDVTRADVNPHEITERVNVEVVDASVGTADIPQETTETERVDALVDATRIPQETTETEKVDVEVVDALMETTKMVDENTRDFETGMQHLETSLPEISSEFPKETNNDDMDMVVEMIMELTKDDVDIPVNVIRSRNRYTPRKISARRDYPLFCGTTGPVPTEEDRARINTSSKEVVVYQQDRSPKRKMHACELDLGGGLERVAKGSLDRGNWTTNGMSTSKAKKDNFSGRDKYVYGSERNILRKKAKKSIPVQKGDHGNLYDTVTRKDKEFGGNIKDPLASQAPHEFEASLPPYGPNTSSHDMRNRVREALHLFRAICRKILQGEEARSRNGEQSKLKEKSSRRIDLIAAKIVKEKGKEVNTDKQILGAVPGVVVGDEFQYRVELAIVGIHRLYQAGIDYMRYCNNDIVAVSIVASGGYDDELDNSDVLIYSGQGGLSGKDKGPEDQKMERGNLALKNSIAKKNPVRVIRGSKETKASESADARGKIAMTYVYDGLYIVERYWQEEGLHGKLVYKFLLRRMPGQPELVYM